MTKQPKTFTPTPRFMQDLKCTQCELEAMLEMMLKINVCVICLKCSPKADLFPYLQAKNN